MPAQRIVLDRWDRFRLVIGDRRIRIFFKGGCNFDSVSPLFGPFFLEEAGKQKLAGCFLFFFSSLIFRAARGLGTLGFLSLFPLLHFSFLLLIAFDVVFDLVADGVELSIVLRQILSLLLDEIVLHFQVF